MSDIVHRKTGADSKFILLLLERFLYPAREAKVNKPIGLSLQKIILKRSKVPDVGAKRTISPKACSGNIITIRTTFMRIVLLLHFIMGMVIARPDRRREHRVHVIVTSTWLIHPLFSRLLRASNDIPLVLTVRGRHGEVAGRCSFRLE